MYLRLFPLYCAAALMCLLMAIACTSDQPSSADVSVSKPLQDTADLRKRRHSTKGTLRTSSRTTTTAATSAPATTPTLVAQAPGTFTIRGRIQNEAGGPISAVKLTLEQYHYGGDIERVPVELDGTFQVQASRKEHYVLYARATDYASVITDKISYNGQDINDLTLVMDKGRDIYGVVKNYKGSPVKSAIVVARPSSFANPYRFSTYESENDRNYLRYIHTDSQGQFAMPMLPMNMGLDIAAEKDSFAHPAVYRLSKNEVPTSGLELVMPRSGKFSGTVEDESGQPVPKANIQLMQIEADLLWKQNVTTGEAGEFSVNPAPYDTSIILAVSKDGFIRQSRPVTITDEPLTVTLVRDELATLTVACVDAQTMKLVTSATISGVPPGAKRATMMFDQVEPGKFRFVAYRDNDLTINVFADGYQDAIWMDKPKGNLQEFSIPMRRITTITGRVIDGATGQPLKDASFAGRGHPPVKTGADGRFEYMVKSYAHEYTATAPDGRPSIPIVPQLPAGQTIDVGDIEIPPNQQLTVRVVKAHGR